jgi:signal transduction histidine kinase
MVEPVPRPPAESNAMEVLSTVSHELRSPLTSIKGFTSLLLNRWDRLPDDQKLLLLQQVNHDADRVTRLVGELLDISRIQTGRLHLRRQQVDVGELARAVVHHVGVEYEELDATLVLPEEPALAWADPDKVVQVLTNLVENACKYADATQVTVEVTTEPDPEPSVLVRVTDKGEGIPAEDLPHVFDQFYQRDQGRPTGTGLGLWISQGLVEAHGGRIRAESEPGQGSTFRFSIPVGRSPGPGEN